jgi:hypothetical protein
MCQTGLERRPAGNRRNTGRLNEVAISCRRHLSTDTILRSSGNRQKCCGRRSKNRFWRAGSFHGGRKRHLQKVAPDRRLEIWSWRPDFEMERRFFAAGSRKDGRRPDTHGVAQIVHRGRREVLAPKQLYGDLEHRVTRSGRARSDPEHAFNGSSLSKP